MPCAQHRTQTRGEIKGRRALCTTPHTTRGEIRAAVLPDDSPHVPRGLRVRCADRVAAIMADGMASTEDGRESGLIRPTRSRRWWRSSIDCGEGKGGAMAATNGGGANKAAAAGQTRRRRDKQGGDGGNKQGSGDKCPHLGLALGPRQRRRAALRRVAVAQHTAAAAVCGGVRCVVACTPYPPYGCPTMATGARMSCPTKRDRCNWPLLSLASLPIWEKSHENLWDEI